MLTDNLGKLIFEAQEDLREMHKEVRILFAAVIWQYADENGNFRLDRKSIEAAGVYNRIEQYEDVGNRCMVYRLKKEM